MNIKNEKPPNLVWESCHYYFNLENEKPVFTYGDTIYNPHNCPIDELVVAHECVHQIQQGEKPDEWWDRYFKDKDFRLDQELAAYRVQYRVAKDVIKDRNAVAKLLFDMARVLSGPVYGNLLSHVEATKKIKNGI